jgi:hypothetical protein
VAFQNCVAAVDLLYSRVAIRSVRAVHKAARGCYSFWPCQCNVAATSNEALPKASLNCKHT